MSTYLVKVPRDETFDGRYGCLDSSKSFLYEEVSATSWSFGPGGALIFERGDRVVAAYNTNSWYSFITKNNRT